MIVDMNKQGIVTLTAENAEENRALFDLANAYNFKNENKVEAEEKPKRKYTYKKRPMQYNKSCPVEGCEHKAKSIVLHLRNKHGILPDGSITDTFTYNGGRRMKGDGAKQPAERPVSMPVVKKSDGGYKLKEESKGGLLGHPDTFTRSRILN